MEQGADGVWRKRQYCEDCRWVAYTSLDGTVAGRHCIRPTRHKKLLPDTLVNCSMWEAREGLQAVKRGNMIRKESEW
jgi:hypothetical protein